jgi:hypothetical protein
MVDISELAQEVEITQGFPGTYQWNRGISYYKNGDVSQGEIHFSLPGTSGTFKTYHISRDYGGKNAQIWYKEGKLDQKWDGEKNVDKIETINLPGSEQSQFWGWYKINKGNCDKAAAEFWTILNG